MIPSQFEYLGRWVDTKHFCAFVYSDKGEMLAKSYQEFIDLIGSGLWFASKAELLKLKVSNPLPLAPEIVIEKPIVAEKPLNAINAKRESTKNALKAATNLGK